LNLRKVRPGFERVAKANRPQRQSRSLNEAKMLYLDRGDWTKFSKKELRNLRHVGALEANIRHQLIMDDLLNRHNCKRNAFLDANGKVSRHFC